MSEADVWYECKAFGQVREAVAEFRGAGALEQAEAWFGQARDGQLKECPGVDSAYVFEHRPGMDKPLLLLSWSDAYGFDSGDDDYDWGDDDEGELDEYEAAAGECGLGPDGFCELAGTEHCDWDCPFADAEIVDIDDEEEVEDGPEDRT